MILVFPKIVVNSNKRESIITPVNAYEHSGFARLVSGCGTYGEY